jgi:ABC-type multidrug transport system fused ATPase/permease subunit
MVQRWLALVLSLVVMFVAIVLVTLVTQLRANSSVTGASLVTLMSFSQSLSNIVRFYAAMETSISAVGRLKNFSSTTKRECLPGEHLEPGEDWPERGEIEIRGLSASYGWVGIVQYSIVWGTGDSIRESVTD